MSIQDDAFDIADALKHRRDGSKESWEHFRDWAWALEEERDNLMRENMILLAAIQLVKGKENEREHKATK